MPRLNVPLVSLSAPLRVAAAASAMLLWLCAAPAPEASAQKPPHPQLSPEPCPTAALCTQRAEQAPDADTRRALFASACRLGALPACFKADLSPNLAFTEGPFLSDRYLSDRCNEGNIPACAALYTAHVTGPDARLRDKAQQWWTLAKQGAMHACNRRRGPACMSWAHMVRQDHARRARLNGATAAPSSKLVEAYRFGCARKHAPACAAFDRLYTEGFVFDPRTFKNTFINDSRFLRKRCSSGEASACQALKARPGLESGEYAAFVGDMSAVRTRYEALLEAIAPPPLPESLYPKYKKDHSPY